MRFLFVGLIASILLAQAASQDLPPVPPPPPASVEPLQTALFSRFTPGMWYENMSISPPGPPNPCYGHPAGSEPYVRCNLQAYQAQMEAIQTSSSPFGLVLFPEASALWGKDVNSGSFFEAFSSPVGSTPCDAANESIAPIQVAMSCGAREGNTTAVVNIYTVMPDSKKFITSIVYGPTGKVIVTYAKHALTSAESTIFSAGPFAPTVFTLPNYPKHIFGLLIANEGFDPNYTGDWSMYTGFKQQGAEFVAWSMGFPEGPFYADGYFSSHVSVIADHVALFVTFSVLEENASLYDGRPVNKTPMSASYNGLLVPGCDGNPQFLDTYVNY